MGVDSTQHCEQTLMFTDIVGYSRLMGRNESLAVEMLGDYRKILLSHIEAQGGQLVEFVGDAIFARFNTATSAVAAAIAIQQHLLAFNEARDKKLPRLQTRIGLNKGDVMLRDGAVFGDAVNIAARLEPLAVADGICISHSVYDEVRFSLSSPAKRLGTQTLKNIQQKIRVYLIKPAGIGWRDHLHYFLRGLNRKIVAYRYPIAVSVLALIAAGIYFIPRWLVPGYAANYVEIADFKNLMNEKGDADYFSAGITEAVRSQLADMRDVYIVDAKEGIHAPIRLEGSVQKLGDNLRIAYRLFRRKDNVQIAGGKLDGTYQDIFILQDRLVGEIARYLADEFQLQNFRPAPLRLTNDITAYDFYLKGLAYVDAPLTHENIDFAMQNFNNALIHDRSFSLANSGLCDAYSKKYTLSNESKWLSEAEKHCLLALEQNKLAAKAYVALANVYKATGRYEKALKFVEDATDLDNKDITVALAMANIQLAIGDYEVAEKLYREIVLKFPKNWIAYSSYGYFLTLRGRYNEAIDSYERSLKITPENVVALNNIASNYMYANKFVPAAEALERASLLDPSGSIYMNSGNLYYISGYYSKAVEMFEEALKLEPNNYEISVNLADAYRYAKVGDKKKMIRFCEKAVFDAESDIKSNPKIAKAYYYLARAQICIGNIPGARNSLLNGDALGGATVDASYAHLKMAVVESDKKYMEVYIKRLLASGYSANLILADPDFALFRDDDYKSLFQGK